MEIGEAFRVVLESGHDIERVFDNDYLYEIEIKGSWRTFTEEEVINFASSL